MNSTTIMTVIVGIAPWLAPVPAVLADGEIVTLTPAEKAAGWVLLFDGESTDAWRGYRQAGFPTRSWKVEDGCLSVSGGGGDIMTKAQYENFEFTLEWKASKGANSGIMYRVSEEYGASYGSGPEYQILDDGGYGSGIDRLAGNSAGACYDLYPPAPAKVLNPAGEWNHARIVMRDGIVKHYLNGIKIVEADLDGEEWKSRVQASKFKQWPNFGVHAVGHIAIQDHGNPLWFRNIRIRNLDAPLPGEIDLLAGGRLDQWTHHLRDDAGMEDVWSMDGEVLTCRGRPVGYIRTSADYTNYVLKLQWRFDPSQAGNSGVLLRMIGEDKVWPKSVEAQLQNGNAGDFWNIDEFSMSVVEERTRGRNTKYTHSNERPLGEWNEYEIIVDGGQVTLIVNDEVLNEAWDVEEIAGKICLQSEGAPIQFRRIRVSEIR